MAGSVFEYFGPKQAAEWENLAGNLTTAVDQIAEQTEPLRDISRTLEEIRGAVVSIGNSLATIASLVSNWEAGAGGAMNVEVHRGR